MTPDNRPTETVCRPRRFRQMRISFGLALAMVILLAFGWTGPSFAVQPDEVLQDPALE